jgi:hypothetical protein
MELLALFARQAALAAEMEATFANLGHAVFAAAALSVETGDLRSALQRRADEAPRGQAELAELSLLLNQLGRLGPDERLVVAQIANDFLGYARRHRP